MITKEQRIKELYDSGLVSSIKTLFANKNVNIPENYYVLIADYFDSLDEVKDSMLIEPTEIAKKLPELVSNIQETNLGGIYGITDENGIRIEQNMSYEQKKLYFFHELTHALQTSNINGMEQCAFYNGHNGMFLTEGSTQYTAELLYNISNGTDMNYRQQPGTVRGIRERNPYSPLSEYQYNGDILMLLSKSMDLPLPQVLALAYKQNGRETLKNIYEGMEGNQGKFEELMKDLEVMYSIDKLLIAGYGKELQKEPPELFRMVDGTQFRANLNTYNELMNKTERELAANYIRNHDTEYVVNNYEEIAQYLTTPELKNNFLAVIRNLQQELEQDGIEINLSTDRHNIPQTEQVENRDVIELPNGFEINEFGEIIRPEQKQEKQAIIEEEIPTFTPPDEPDKLSFKQRIAQMLKRNNVLMNISFFKKFVDRQLNILPTSTQERIEIYNNTRQSFENYITKNGALRNLPPIQRMSDPEKIARMQRKMEQEQQLNDDYEK